MLAILDVESRALVTASSRTRLGDGGAKRDGAYQRAICGRGRAGGRDPGGADHRGRVGTRLRRPAPHPGATGLWREGSGLQAGGESGCGDGFAARCTGRRTVKGAPPTEPAKYEPDHSRLAR